MSLIGPQEMWTSSSQIKNTGYWRGSVRGRCVTDHSEAEGKDSTLEQLFMKGQWGKCQVPRAAGTVNWKSSLVRKETERNSFSISGLVKL